MAVRYKVELDRRYFAWMRHRRIKHSMWHSFTRIWTGSSNEALPQLIQQRFDATDRCGYVVTLMLDLVAHIAINRGWICISTRAVSVLRRLEWTRGTST